MTLKITGCGTKSGPKGHNKTDKIIHSKKRGTGRLSRACYPQYWITFTHVLHIYCPPFLTGYLSLYALKPLMKELLKLPYATLQCLNNLV